MTIQLPMLSIIINELLPFVRGSDLLALSLTCRFLHERIFQSKRWKALSFIKYIGHTWNYGLLVIDIWTNISFEQQIMLDKYYETGLPMEIHLGESDRNFVFYPACQWIKAVTKIKIHDFLANLDSLVERGLLPERLEFISLSNLPGTFKNLERLTQVKTLELFYVDFEELKANLKVLNLLSNLQKLKIRAGYFDCLDLVILENVTALKFFVHGLLNLSALSHLTQLKKLKISTQTSGNFYDISFLESLDNLEILELDYCGAINKFPSSPPKNLKKLKLEGIPNENLDWLSGWVSLEDIKLSGPNVIDINGLKRCVNLKKVDFGDSMVKELKPLANCRNLAEIHCNGSQCNDWDSLSELPHLQSIVSSFKDGIPESFSRLKINCLKIHDYYGVLNLTDAFLKRLKHVQLLDVRLENIPPLQFATELTFLRLKKSYIIDIQPLIHLVQLERLDLEGNQIEDIAPLAGLLKLKYLNINDNRIVNIEPLSNLVELEKLRLAFNKIVNIQPLLKLKKLDTLNLGPHANSDLELEKTLMRWKSDNYWDLINGVYHFDD